MKRIYKKNSKNGTSIFGLTKVQFVASAVAFFTCFAVFLGVLLAGGSTKHSVIESRAAIVGSAVDMGDVDYWIKDPNYYSLDWYNNAAEGVGDSADNPYLISSAQDLAGLSYLVYTNPETLDGYNADYVFSGKYFKQTTDINLSAHTWQPIGIYYDRNGTSQSNYFSGNYDGGGFTVSGINTPAGSSDAYSYQGLFGRVWGQSSSRVVIQNVEIVNSNIQGYCYVGGVVGSANETNLVNCHCASTVVVSATGEIVGGVIGSLSALNYNAYVSIVNSSNKSKVECLNDHVGGIAGQLGNYVNVKMTYNTGNISGLSQVGGVVGGNFSYVTIENCYNTGSVSGSSSVGGVVGEASLSNTTITNCYNTGDITGSGNLVGGVAGYGSATNCFNTGAVTGTGSNDGGISGHGTIKTSYYGGACQDFRDGNYLPDIVEKAKTLEWYQQRDIWDSSAAWDFDLVWAIYSTQNDGYPIFIKRGEENWWIADQFLGIEGGLDFNWEGDGTKASPYKITTEWELAGLSYIVYYANDLSGRLSTALATKFFSYVTTSDSVHYVFSGVYFEQTANLDLSEHIWQPIGIYYDRNGTLQRNYFSGNYDGDGFTVSGIKTPAGSSDAYSYQGLFGYVKEHVVIQNVGIVNSNIQGYRYVGGVVGYGNYLKIQNCYNTGSVTGSGAVGGVAGSGDSTNCYNTGSVTSSGTVGGVVGSGSATNCYNTGSVSGSDYVGGVVGSGSATNCFNTGPVTGTGSNVGGISGRGTVKTSYYGGACQDFNDEYYLSDIVEKAKTLEWYQQSAIWDSSAVWNFAFIWTIDSTQNDGYPIFIKRGEENWWIADQFLTGGAEVLDFSWEGDGSKENPFKITSEWELAGLSYIVYYANDLVGRLSTALATKFSSYVTTGGSVCYVFSGVYFKQTANLDLSEHIWQPIGFRYDRNGTLQLNYFSANYDGGGFTVSGIKTPAGGSDAYSYQGLFGYVEGQSSSYAVIQNVGIVNSNIQGYRYVGGVVGYGYYSTIQNCYNMGDVTGSGDYVGGVVGDGSATNCYNTGSVSGSDYVGGVSGSGSATNCYNTGSVTGSGDRVGGVTGSGSATNCFNTGAVTGTGSNVGGISGSGTIKTSYYGGNCQDFGDENYLPDIVEKAKTLEWYSDTSLWTNDYNTYQWNFLFVWQINSTQNDGYPIFVKSGEENWWIADQFLTGEAEVLDFSWEGDGSKEHPYKISTEWELAGLSYIVYYANDLNNHLSSELATKFSSYVTTSGSERYVFSGVYFEQTANLDLSEHIWQPIGIWYDRNGTLQKNCFSGNYDGGGFTVSGIKTPAGSGGAYSYQGLFGYVYGESNSKKATIQNLGVINSTIQGYGSVGGVVGSGIYSTIQNCYNTGSVTGSSTVGGAVGYARFGSVTNCYNTGSVTGTGNGVGGVVGDGSATNCYNTGTVTGTGQHIGGVVANGEATNCYNRGLVSGGTYYIGGVVGNGSATNCYNTGSVTSSGQYVGGVVGYASSTVYNSFNTGNVSGTQNFGGVTGYGSFMKCYYGGACQNFNDGYYLSDIVEKAKTLQWYSDTSLWTNDYNATLWDFFAVWEIVPEQNDGYPILIKENNWWLASEDYYDISWYQNSDTGTYGDGSQNNPYKISTPEQLAGVSYLVYNGQTNFSGIYFEQTQPIDLSAHYWQPIGISYNRTGQQMSRSFQGNYDGGDFTISGLKTKQGRGHAYNYQGLFGRIQYSTIENVGVINSDVKGAGNVAGVVASAYDSIITNCYNSGDVEGYDYNNGGDLSVGGVLGYAGYEVTVSYCYNDGNIIGHMEQRGAAGGVVGSVSSNNGTVQYSYNLGNVTTYGDAADYVGGVIGDSNIDQILSCYNEGTITSEAGRLGGLAGRAYGVSECYNTGEVIYSCDSQTTQSATKYIGGLVGQMYGRDTASGFVNSYNLGKITINSTDTNYNTLYVGGLLGDFSASSTTIINSYNRANIELNISNNNLSQICAGGLVGSLSGVLSSSYNTGSISGSIVTSSATIKLAGVVGTNEGDISDVFSVGNINVTISGGNSTISGVSTNGSSTNAFYYSTVSADGSGATVSSTLDDDVKNYTWITTNIPGFDFLFSWTVNPEVNDGYPSYKTADDPIVWWLGNDPETGEAYYDISWFVNAENGVGDSEDNPYLIKDAADLAGLSYLVYNGGYTNSNGQFVSLETSTTLMGTSNGGYFGGKYFKQKANIDLSGLAWQPIGIVYHRITSQMVGHAFAGHYDGSNYSVTGVETPAGTKASYSYQGLFGYVHGYVDGVNFTVDMATISNLTVANSNINGAGVVSSVVGLAIFADITNCNSYADVIINGTMQTTDDGGILPENKNFASGIVGVMLFSNLDGAVFAGKISTTIFSGNGDMKMFSGIVGYSYNAIMYEEIVGKTLGNIKNCYNYSNIGPEWNYNFNEIMEDMENMTEEEMIAIEMAYIQLLTSVSSGIISGACNTTIINANNFGTVTGMGSAGILFSPSTLDVVGSEELFVDIQNCLNAGVVKGAAYTGGLIGIGMDMFYGGRETPILKISDSANIGDLFLVSVGENGYVGGLIGVYFIGNQAHQLKNNLVQCTIFNQIAGSYIGGISGMAALMTQDVFIDNCFVDITIQNDDGAYTISQDMLFAMLEGGESSGNIAKNTYGVINGQVINVQDKDYAVDYKGDAFELVPIDGGETISSKTIEINGKVYTYSLSPEPYVILTLTSADGERKTNFTITLKNGKTYYIFYDDSSRTVTLIDSNDGTTYSYDRYSSITIDGVQYSNCSFSTDNNNILYDYGLSTYDETSGTSYYYSNRNRNIIVDGVTYSYDINGNSLTLTNGETTINNKTTINIGGQEYNYSYENGVLTITPVGGGDAISSQDGFVKTYLAFDNESALEGKFIYLDGFKNGKPIPIKTDGTYFYHILNQGNKTGIYEKLAQFGIAPQNLLEKSVFDSGTIQIQDKTLNYSYSDGVLTLSNASGENYISDGDKITIGDLTYTYSYDEENSVLTINAPFTFNSTPMNESGDAPGYIPNAKNVLNNVTFELGQSYEFNFYIEEKSADANAIKTNITLTGTVIDGSDAGIVDGINIIMGQLSNLTVGDRQIMCILLLIPDVTYVTHAGDFEFTYTGGGERLFCMQIVDMAIEGAAGLTDFYCTLNGIYRV